MLKGNCITLLYDLTVTLEFGIYAKILLVSNPQFNKRNTILPTKLLVEKLRYNDRYECDLRNILKTYTRKLASSYFIDYATTISSNKRIKLSTVEGTNVVSKVPTITPYYDDITAQVQKALQLDFKQNPRPSRCLTGTIQVNSRKQATKEDRYRILLTVHTWGGQILLFHTKTSYVLLVLHPDSLLTILDTVNQ